MYLIYGKNICKCHHIPPPRTTIKEKKKKETLLQQIPVRVAGFDSFISLDLLSQG
jgi:hypothetical protein